MDIYACSNDIKYKYCLHQHLSDQNNCHIVTSIVSVCKDACVNVCDYMCILSPKWDRALLNVAL